MDSQHEYLSGATASVRARRGLPSEEELFADDCGGRLRRLPLYAVPDAVLFPGRSLPLTLSALYEAAWCRLIDARAGGAAGGAAGAEGAAAGAAGAEGAAAERTVGIVTRLRRSKLSHVGCLCEIARVGGGGGAEEEQQEGEGGEDGFPSGAPLAVRHVLLNTLDS